MLNENELYYRKVMTSIGLTMLAFAALINLVGIVVQGASLLLSILPIGAVAGEVFYQLLYAACYLLAFMLPVLVLKWRMKKLGYFYAPIKTDLGLSPILLPIIFGGITLIWAQSNINASLVSIFNYSEFSSEVIWGGSSELPKGYQLVLIFLVNALVPAFCEEFLFRGAILTNCLPFGRSNAILISSLLFSLMHQNAEQILYAFAAGILLGLVYERTKSIWPCVFLHMINNFMSTALSIFAASFGFTLTGVAYLALECALYAIGMICVLFLVIHESKQKKAITEGVFGESFAATDAYAAVPIAPRNAVRLFLNVPMIIFLALCVVQIITLLGISLLYGLA